MVSIGNFSVRNDFSSGNELQSELSLISRSAEKLEPTLGKINLFSYSPELLVPFIGLQDTERDDDPWNRPHSYHDGNLYVFSDGRNRIRRDTFGSTQKMYLYEIGMSPAEKRLRQFDQWKNSLNTLWQPINWDPYYQLMIQPFVPRLGTTKISITPPIIPESDVVDCEE